MDINHLPTDQPVNTGPCPGRFALVTRYLIFQDMADADEDRRIDCKAVPNRKGLVGWNSGLWPVHIFARIMVFYGFLTLEHPSSTTSMVMLGETI